MKKEVLGEHLAIKPRLVSELIPYARNAKNHPEEQISKIAASIKEFGFNNPVAVDGDNGIIAGHGRVMAAQKLGLKTVPTVELSHLSETQKRAYIIADNKTAESDWLGEMLSLEMKELALEDDFDMSLLGFDKDELGEFLNYKTSELPAGGLTDEDEEPPPPEDPVTKLGDVWILGNHRLMCGDSTQIDQVEVLLDGEKADITFTDPPYGVAYTGGAKKREALANDERGTVIYDEVLPVIALVTKKGAPLYLWYADVVLAAAAAAAAAAGYEIKAQIAWVKNNAQFVTSAHYKGKHELCMYAHQKGERAPWYGPNNEVTVWNVDRANKNEYHPTQKPVALSEKALTNSSKTGDIVLDLFGGSGSTMIGAEKIGRHARLMELQPTYCDVIVKRWQEFTGKQATLELDGLTFNQYSKERKSLSKKA